MKLQLIYFEGCPNAKPAKDMLDEIGVSYESVRQDDLSENDPLAEFSSPTLLKGDDIVFGAIAKGGGCSMTLPSIEVLRGLLGR